MEFGVFQRAEDVRLYLLCGGGLVKLLCILSYFADCMMGYKCVYFDDLGYITDTNTVCALNHEKLSPQEQFDSSLNGPYMNMSL